MTVVALLWNEGRPSSPSFLASSNNLNRLVISATSSVLADSLVKNQSIKRFNLFIKLERNVIRHDACSNTLSLYKLLRAKPIHFDYYQKSADWESNAGFYCRYLTHARPLQNFRTTFDCR